MEQTGSEGSKQGAKGANREQRGAKGVNRGQRGAKGANRGQRGAKRVKGSEGSEYISILGFRVPPTCGGKKFGDHLQWMSVPTTWN